MSALDWDLLRRHPGIVAWMDDTLDGPRGHALRGGDRWPHVTAVLSEGIMDNLRILEGAMNDPDPYRRRKTLASVIGWDRVTMGEDS